MQEWVQEPGLSEGPASGFTQATHSRPLAAQEPSSSFKVLGWGCLHSFKSPRRHCTAPRDRTKPAPCLKGSVGLLQLLAASTSTHTLSPGQETVSREDVAEG